MSEAEVRPIPMRVNLKVVAVERELGAVNRVYVIYVSFGGVTNVEEQASTEYIWERSVSRAWFIKDPNKE